MGTMCSGNIEPNVGIVLTFLYLLLMLNRSYILVKYCFVWFGYARHDLRGGSCTLAC